MKNNESVRADQKSAADKKAARVKARLLLSNVSAAQREDFSQKAAVSFLNSSIYKDAECVAAFLSMPDEVDTLPVLEQAARDKKTILLPRVVPGSNQMDFYELETRGLEASQKSGGLLGLQALDAQTETNAWGIREPLLSLPRVPKEKIPARTAILVPGLAFAKGGRRLGRGKGFYDRYLSELLAANPAFAAQGKICGYCMATQIADNVPTEENDVLMQALFC